MTERLNEVGTNEIRPKYNRSVLENQAYYNSNQKPVKHVAAPWAMNTDSSFSTFDVEDRNRRKAKSVLRTIPNSYQDEQ